MGFNKRNVDKENILFHIRNKNLTSLMREMKINMLFKADALIMDSWAGKFYHDLNPQEREIRKKLADKYKYNSDPAYLKDDEFKKLTSLSEALISLVGDNPQWMDIHIVINKLNIPVDNETEAGRSEILREKCIDAIINHFDGK